MRAIYSVQYVVQAHCQCVTNIELSKEQAEAELHQVYAKLG